MDSTAAIEGGRTDSIGPSQRFAMADIETSTRLRARGNEVTIRWVPTHQGAPGNEKADKYVKIAADGERPDDAVSDDYRWETSLSHMTRVATEARARSTAQWITERTEDPRGRYRPPRGRALKRKLFRRARKSVASRYY